MRARAILAAMLLFAPTVSPAADTGAPRAAPVPGAEARGIVLGDGKPLARVPVSDGHRVVLTAQDGRFAIPLDGRSGPFLFVTTPTGWWTDAFFRPAAKAAADPTTFVLDRVEQDGGFAFVFLTDVHLGEGKADAAARMRATLAEVRGLVPRPAFAIFGGDITIQGHQGQALRDLIREAGIRARHAIGNHELLGDALDPRARFHALFGPTYHSFRWGGVHFILLDGCRFVPGEKGYKNVHGRLSDREIHWLRADLAAKPPGMPAVAAIHIPLVTTYAERRGWKPEDAPFLSIRNADQVIPMLEEGGVRLVLQGHLHENENLLVHGIEFQSSISSCGRWWANPTGPQYGVDGVPRGYRVIRVRDGRIAHAYRPSAESYTRAPGRILGLDAPLRAGADPARALVNVYDGRAATRVRARIDGGPWKALDPALGFDEALKLRRPHHWALPLDPTRLGAGRHAVEVSIETSGVPPSSLRRDFEVAP